MVGKTFFAPLLHIQINEKYNWLNIGFIGEEEKLKEVKPCVI